MAAGGEWRRGALSGSIERLGGSGERVAEAAIVSDRPTLVYVLPDKIGGVFSIVANLLEYRRSDEFDYRAVLTRNRKEDAECAAGAGTAINRENTFVPTHNPQYRRQTQAAAGELCREERVEP